MENHERVERELLEQCGQITTLVECFAWLQRCDECIKQLEELCRTKRPRLAVEHKQSVTRIARLAGAKSQLEQRFVHIGSTRVATNDLLFGERSTRSYIDKCGAQNSNHIEPRQFFENAENVALERVRDAVERHGSVKVNAFNGEFAKDKRVNKSIDTNNSEIYRYTDLCVW